MMTIVLRSLVFIVGLLIPSVSFAAPATIVYAYKHHIFSLNTAAHPEWKAPQAIWMYHGIPADPPARLLTCGAVPVTEPGWTKGQTSGWNETAIRRTIEREIAAKLDRPAGSVTIGRSASGSIVFDGEGLPGRTVHVAEATRLTLSALKGDIDTVLLPVAETAADVTVNDPELQAQGIREVVTVGESVFVGSPVNRRHNIGVGVSKFNGHLIPQGSIFSFDETLGRVDDTTGYRKELVIQADTTIPDYGGGLCQVSSTAYRGPWEYGLPIVQRRNHSYAVSYYGPQGTDATIYPPNVDLKFRNDTPGALLIQSFVRGGDHAYFIYYGTQDARATEVFGPFISNRNPAPLTEKTVYTNTIPVGERRKAGEKHDGLTALWYRSVHKEGTGTTLERILSVYEARPLTWQIGVTSEEMRSRTAGTASGEPSWLPKNDVTSASSSGSR